MFGTHARRLAVASLTEAGDAATVLWRRNGQPLQGYVLVTGEGTDCRVTVYVQQGDWGPTAVLAGDMVWFQSPAEGAAEPPEAPRRAPEPEPAAEPEPAPPEEEPAEIGFKLYPEPATPVTAFPAHKIEVIVTPVDEGPAAPDATQAPPADRTPASAPAPDPTPDPAPKSGPAPGDAPIALLSRHPLAPRARGTARVDPAQGTMTIAAWGLPSASQLGPSYNAYRAWLLNQRAGTRESLGLLTRAWGDNYRLETTGDLPMSHFDAIIITAEDRRAATAHQNPPQVLFGTYR